MEHPCYTRQIQSQPPENFPQRPQFAQMLEQFIAEQELTCPKPQFEKMSGETTKNVLDSGLHEYLDDLQSRMNLFGMGRTDLFCQASSLLANHQFSRINAVIDINT